ncbi:MAG: zinc-dependent metalloprotease, partial [Balneolaceae bacterium]
ILGADIMLEWVFFSNQVRTEDIFTETMTSTDTLNESMNPVYCSFGRHMQHNNLFGTHALRVMGAADEELEDYTHEALTMLILHELGHTLGLNHNMQASTLHSPEDIHSEELANTIGLTGSVMDYSSVNVNPDRDNQGRYYDIKPGPYDVWAIEFGYSPAVDNPEREEERLQSILSRSTEPELAFGNDADDMRSPGKAIDPRVMVGDMSSDPVAYGVSRIEMADNLMDGLLEKYGTREGQSYQELRNAYMVLRGQKFVQTGIISRQIGGVYRDRGFIGQEGSDKPFTPVPAEKQKEAMSHLSKYLFAPDAFDSSHEVYNYLQIQRRGFNFFSSSEDPKIHDQVLSMQAGALAHLLHPATMKRITDSRTYGNTYPVADVVGDLTAAIFKADARGNVNTFRQNLQVHYVTRLTEILESDDHDHIAKSSALYNLQNIRAMMDNKGNINNETKAHTAYIAQLIDSAFD